jgi:hypothetical protein
VGSVYDAFNLGNGYENVYTAIPGTAGGADTITDTLVTPFGNVNLDSLFGSIDAAAPMQPGDAFTGLEAGDSSIGADAFTIGSTTFDPITSAGTEGYDTVYQIIGAPPLLEIGGGTPNIDGFTLAIVPQEFNVYDGSGSSATEVGSIVGNEDVTDLLGLTNTEFTVASVTGTSSDLPTVGSVYDVFNLGDGIENVYTAIPGVDGAADTITDTLVTPWGTSTWTRCSAVSTLLRRWTRATPSALVLTRRLLRPPPSTRWRSSASEAQPPADQQHQTSQALSGLGCLALRPRRGKRMKMPWVNLMKPAPWSAIWRASQSTIGTAWQPPSPTTT